MANTLRKWKGAVQPAESGASGNELRLWKGAVQPAHVSSSSDALISGITSGVVGNITRGVTESWSNR